MGRTAGLQRSNDVVNMTLKGSWMGLSDSSVEEDNQGCIQCFHHMTVRFGVGMKFQDSTPRATQTERADHVFQAHAAPL
jgi:hypothetical protein